MDLLRWNSQQAAMNWVFLGMRVKECFQETKGNRLDRGRSLTMMSLHKSTFRLQMPCGATQDGWVTMERSDRMCSPGEANGKPLQYSCLENPMNSMKRQNDRILKGELPRSIGAQYATGDQQTNNSERMTGWSQSKNNTQVWM